MSDFEQTAALSRQRHLLECAEQERRDLERAYALVHSDPERIEAALAAARREGAEAERARHEGASEIIQRAAKLIKTGEEAALRREGAEEMRERLLSSLSYPNRSALRENVRENLEQQYANIFGKRCSTDAARRLAECALETTVDFLVRALPLTPEERA